MDIPMLNYNVKFIIGMGSEQTKLEDQQYKPIGFNLDFLFNFFLNHNMCHIVNGNRFKNQRMWPIRLTVLRDELTNRNKSTKRLGSEEGVGRNKCVLWRWVMRPLFARIPRGSVISGPFRAYLHVAVMTSLAALTYSPSSRRG